ncbi:MAG: phosphotransferase family protein [Acidimicrobiia bacterium]
MSRDDRHVSWHFRLARMYQTCREWASAARAYEAAIGLDSRHPSWHFRLACMRAKCREWASAARACEAAIALDGHQPAWFLGLARMYERCNDWPGAARAYEAAIALGDTCPDWQFKLGCAYERTSQWPAAARAYEAAVAGDDRKMLWQYRLGRARLILAGANGPAADQCCIATYGTSGGDAALRRLLAQHAGHPFDQGLITSEPLRGGTSIAVKHTLRKDVGTLPRCMAHKITTNRNEARVAQLLAGVDQLPLEISTPELLAVVDTDEVVHLFFEFVPMRLGFDCSQESFERYGEIYAAFGRIVTDDDLDTLSRGEYSAESLLARLEQLESLDAYKRALDLDAAVGIAFQTIEAEVGDLAAAAAAMPWVFSHNDAGIGNVMSRRDSSGRITSIVVIDWGFAGLNLAGADLHHLLRHPGVSDDLINALVAGYCRAARERLPGLRADHVRFAANLYCFQRASELSRRHPMTPEALRHALTFGRTAAELAAR